MWYVTIKKPLPGWSEWPFRRGTFCVFSFLYPNKKLHVYKAGYYEEYESADENGDLCKSEHIVSYYIITHESEKNEDNIDEWFFDAVNTMLRKTENKKKIKTNKNYKRIEIRLSNKETLR